MKIVLEKKLHKEAAEVEAELEYCISRIICYEVIDITRRIEKGKVEVTDQISQKTHTIDLSNENIRIQEDQWECMLKEATRVTKFIPREERRVLTDIEASRYHGAICALRWLLGQHDEDLPVYLASDRFETVFELTVN